MDFIESLPYLMSLTLKRLRRASVQKFSRSSVLEFHWTKRGKVYVFKDYLISYLKTPDKMWHRPGFYSCFGSRPSERCGSAAITYKNYTQYSLETNPPVSFVFELVSDDRLASTAGARIHQVMTGRSSVASGKWNMYSCNQHAGLVSIQLYFSLFSPKYIYHTLWF